MNVTHSIRGRARKSILVFITITFISTSTIAYLAIRDLSDKDPWLLFASQKISKALIMRVFDQVASRFGSNIYAPTPFDSPDFLYADLSHPYFEKIRNDKRVAHFYSKHAGPIDFSDAVSIREYLRDLFPHGRQSKSYRNINVLEMIDAAENGEKFLCGNISKMLAQLIQAGGTQARTVGLSALQNGHVVVELWSKRFNKWVIIDPDYNVHYTDVTGTPLSALELYQMSQDSHKLKNINRVAGDSPNTLHNSDTKLVESYYRNGLIIYFYNRWVDQNLPRRNPVRSPSIMGYYVGKSVIEKLSHKHGSEILDYETSAELYKNPSEYQAARNLI